MRSVFFVTILFFTPGCEEDPPPKPPPCPEYASGYTDKEKPAPEWCVPVLRPKPGVLTEVDRAYWKVIPDTGLNPDQGLLLLEALRDPRTYISIAAYTRLARNRPL